MQYIDSCIVDQVVFVNGAESKWRKHLVQVVREVPGIAVKWIRVVYQSNKVLLERYRERMMSKSIFIFRRSLFSYNGKIIKNNYK